MSRKAIPSLDRSLRWIVAGIWGGGLLLGLVVVGLLWRGMASATQTEELRHQVIADRVFAGMERELAAFVAAEGQRPFSHYRSTFVPPGEEIAVPSPLASVPEHPAVLAYRQVGLTKGRAEPSSPLAGEALEAETAVRREAASRALRLLGYGEPANDAAVAEPGEQQQQRKETAQAPFVAQQRRNEQFEEVALLQALEETPPDQAQQRVFSPGANTLDNFVEPQEAGVNLVQGKGKKSATRPVDAAPLASEVVVSPFEVVRDRELLVLHRRVDLGADAFVQVVVLDGARFLASLGETVLARGDLDRYAELVALDSPLPDQVYEYVHEFGPSYGMTARLFLQQVPGPGARARTTLWVMGLVVLVVLLVGLAVLQRAVAATVRYAQQRSEFVSAVTHELRTPLTTIRMYAEMLEGEMVPPERRDEYVSTMRKQAERLGGLVEDVLAMAKLEQGEAREAGEALEPLADVVHRVAGVLEPQARAKGLSLNLAFPTELGGAPVVGAPVERILTNLVSNAVKFSDDGEVRIGGRMERTGLHLVVEDEGPGVAPELLQTIFEPFFRAERELTRKTSGTGIGLSLVARLASSLGGTVRASNRATGGLRVELWLPDQSGAAGEGSSTRPRS